MFQLFRFDEHDLKNVRKLKESNVTSHRVVGRGTLVSDASDIRQTEKFRENAERASKLVAAG